LPTLRQVAKVSALPSPRRQTRKPEAAGSADVAASGLAATAQVKYGVLVTAWDCGDWERMPSSVGVLAVPQP
jgi:hypothetical protein